MKVGIVGCGIAGGYLAYRLSKKHDVTVFEHKKKIGKKACSGLVSERLWDFIPKNNKLVNHRIKKIIIHFPKKDVELVMDPPMMILDHDKLDRYVASLGSAKILLDKHVTAVSEEGILRADGEEYNFDYIIGADGPMSVVRKSIHGTTPKFSLGVFVYDDKDKAKKSDVVETWPLNDGFAWKIPRGDKVEYGVMEDPKVAMKEFKKLYKKKPKEIFSSLIPQGLVTSHTKRIAVVGDAAGLTKPWSGGGIIWSLQSVDMLVNNFPNFDKYNRELKEFFEPRIITSKFASKLGVQLGNNLPWLTPNKVLFDSDWIF